MLNITNIDSDALLVKLYEKSDTLSYKPFLNNGFYKLVYKHFYCLCLREAKTVSHILHILHLPYCLIWFGVTFGVTVFKVLCFWCSLFEVIENQRFFSNCPLINVCQYIFLCISLWLRICKHTTKNDERNRILSFL